MKGRPLTADDAESDVEEFEFLLSSGETMETAVRRMGMSARSVTRRYELLGRKCPAGLYYLATKAMAS
ncbi:hypothetical protein [Mycolicibacterium conceptionense]|uniref:hypothetical protein n=1 Tax=Mycolicibacterium conceptionense TaxID=451644 RepID=UPI00096FD7F5|nr:hypothetical protein [Mycolicibacterium conceptionense]OMB79245.1 hypothetical protein A5743_14160 [Mycolicibacterium conceptionense]